MTAPLDHASATDLKFLDHLLQVRHQELQIESGTRIISLLIPLFSEVRVTVVRQ